MSGAAAAALPGESTDFCFSQGGKGVSKGPLGRLSSRANAVKAALARSPGGTPEQKKSRTEDMMDVEFHPVPAFPGVGGNAEPSTAASAAVAPGMGLSSGHSGACKGPSGG
eukprot:5097325-Pyramimonas_sp.AAC.1